MNHTVCLLNDSFPPQIDGVANTVVNYANIIEKNHGHALVVTPEYELKNDDIYSFPVLRYPSLDTRKFIGYMAGIPFSPTITKRLKDENVEILHCHCPAAALLLARELRFPLDCPVVMTYHTKYDVDLLKAIKLKLLTFEAVRIMIANINSCDEVWTVSRGAGDNLKNLGFQGDYIIMPNGVDLPKERVPEEETSKVSAAYDLPRDVPLFLFVGRMFWYKGIRIILDALSILKAGDFDFRMVFVGDGADFNSIKEYCEESGLSGKVVFTGSITDREQIRAWYCRADLFLFPSTYDTNGLVVREAASCSLPSVLIKNSCAAEDITDGRNGFLIDESSESLARKLTRVAYDPELLIRVGENAAEEIYISWESAVSLAVERYEIVMDNYKAGRYPKPDRISDHLMARNGELMSLLSGLLTN